MPRKEPNWDDIERTAREIDALTAQYDSAYPPATCPPPNFYGLTDEELAEASRPLTEIVAEARERAAGGGPEGSPGSGSGSSPEKPILRNEIEIESKPAPKPRRKRGQRTKQGQVIASRNSIKHGILSPAPVVDDFETLEAWEAHRLGIRDSIVPLGQLEEDLADRYAAVSWRLRRVLRYETASIKWEIAKRRRRWEENEDDLDDLGEPPGDPVDLAVQIDYEALPDEETTDKVIRYETHLHRQSIQLLHEMEAMQARRNGERTPLARLDFSGPPS